MILVETFLPFTNTEVFTDEFTSLFNVVIQLGAILAVVTLYFDKLNPFSPHKSPKTKAETWSLWKKVIVGCVPAGVIGLLFDDWLDAHFYNAYVIGATLILYGIAFILVENHNQGKKSPIQKFSQLDYKTVVMIGIFQVLALIPGTSRSGATILGGILFGCSRTIAAEFTFYLAIPVMFGASALKILKYGFHFTGTQLGILLFSMVIAYVVSVLAIRFLMGYIKKHDFKVFGWYRIVLGILVLAVLLL